MSKKLFLFILLSVSVSVSTSAYEIGMFQETPPNVNLEDSDIDVKAIKVVFQKNHEKLTALALLCLAEANKGNDNLNIKPLECTDKTPDIPKLETFLNNPANTQDYPDAIDEYKRLIYDVRWPDDPIRFVETAKGSAAKFALLIKNGCKERLDEKGDLSINSDGHFCTSHFGKLQFLHAMKYKDPDPTLDPDTNFDERTYSLMKEWAEFSFEIGSNTKLQQEGYCTYWSKDNHKYPNLASAMYESSLLETFCKDNRFNYHRLYWPWFDNYSAWQVSSTFTFKCHNAFSSGTCNVMEDKETAVSFSTLGSIIHMIQDSYSTAHTSRTNQCNHEALVVTNPVESYQDYFLQKSEVHAQSDLWPTFVGDGLTLDPITASAQVIWLKHNQSSADISITDILEQVINGVTKN